MIQVKKHGEGAFEGEALSFFESRGVERQGDSLLIHDE